MASIVEDYSTQVASKSLSSLEVVNRGRHHTSKAKKEIRCVLAMVVNWYLAQTRMRSQAYLSGNNNRNSVEVDATWSVLIASIKDVSSGERMPSRRTDYVKVEEEGAKGENERCGDNNQVLRVIECVCK